MADVTDSKSVGLITRAGSTPATGTTKDRPAGGGPLWFRRRVSSGSPPQASGRPNAKREEVPLGHSTPATTSSRTTYRSRRRFYFEITPSLTRFVGPPFKIGPAPLGSDFVFWGIYSSMVMCDSARQTEIVLLLFPILRTRHSTTSPRLQSASLVNLDRAEAGSFLC